MSTDWLPWIPIGTGAIITALMGYIVSDFKDFKHGSQEEFKSIAEARQEAVNEIRNFVLKMTLEVNKLEMIHGKFEMKVENSLAAINIEMNKFLHDVEKLNGTAKTAEDLFRQSLKLAQALNQKVNHHAKEIESIKVALGNNGMVMIKTKK